MAHYFSNDYTKSNKKSFDFKFNEQSIKFTTDDNVFSKSEVDFGSQFLVQTILRDTTLCGNVLDLGCGYGAITILLAKNSNAKIIGCDVNERAVELAKENAKNNNVQNQTDFIVSDVCAGVQISDFDFVVSNPPIRAGNKILDEFFISAYQKLKIGGVAYWVFRKQQGAETYTKKLSSIFSNAEIMDKKKSYWIVKCEKIK